MNQQSELYSWLWLFGRWLRETTRNKSKLPKPLSVYDRWTEGDKKILESRLALLPDTDSRFRRPGAVATWNLINKEFPAGGVLITLDNLYKLSLELPKDKRGEIVKQGLQRSSGLTHRFQVSWVLKSDRHFRFVVIDSFDIDLASQFIDEAPKDVIRYVALEAFSMRLIPGLNWQQRIYHFPWYETIRWLSSRKGCPENPRHRRLCKRIVKVTF